MKRLVSILAAAFAGAVIVVACSDDSPHDVDAATCDCPAAEAPISASRIHRVDDGGTLAANSVGEATAGCPAGELLVSGSCYVDVDNTAREVTLVQAGALPSGAAMEARGWGCRFVNHSATATATYRAQALCLRPAP
jgi:hypothetical protein